MAQLLKLYRGSTEVLDLLAGDVRLRAQGWQPQIGGAEDAMVWDTLDLVGRASSDANYMTAIYNIQDWITDAREYHRNINRDDPCWFHYQSQSGAEVRALVYDGNLELPGEGKMGALMNNSGLGVARLAIARSPWWERGTAVSVSTTGVSVLGGEWAPTVASGNLPGRIGSFAVAGVSATTGIDDIWVGVRPTYEGTASFDPIWIPANGTLGTDAATGASGQVTVSFASSTAMVERLRISVAQILGGNYPHEVGSYLVLGRIKSSSILTAAERFLIRCYQGMLGGEIELTGEVAFNPDSTTDRLVELGYFRIPPFGNRIGVSMAGYSTIYIYAQRRSGTATLTIDGIYLIPVEPILTLKTGVIREATDGVTYYSSPAGDATAVVDVPSAQKVCEYTAGDMLWPIDGGVVVVAAQQEKDSKTGITVDLTMTVFPRYSLVRDT